MTRIVAGLESLTARKGSSERECLWWSVENPMIVWGPRWIRVSGIIPDGTIVREVAIQAYPRTDSWRCIVEVVLSVVSSKNPTEAEIEVGMRLIPWHRSVGPFGWESIGQQINERWPLHKTLRGSDLRFAVAILSGAAAGMACRVSVLYELP